MFDPNPDVLDFGIGNLELGGFNFDDLWSRDFPIRGRFLWDVGG